MPLRFRELPQRPSGKKARPLHWFTIHQFLSQRHAHLYIKLEKYLLRESRKAKAVGSKRGLTSRAFATLYPNTVRYSIFIILYSQFEYTLNEICHELEKDYPSAIKLSDLNHKGIRRAHRFLEKVVRIEQPFEPEPWKRLEDLNILRNAIVHNDAKVEKHQSDLIQTIERINKWAPVRIEEHKVFLSPSFIEHASNLMFEQVQYIGVKLQAAGWD
jgi:hypothetical protein